MSEWIPALLEKLAAGTPVVRMAVATVRGSAPREPGATMLFWIDEQQRTRSFGTIGGGHLEARAMEIAAHLLDPAAARRRVERFTLGATLGQCCGGVVELYWERYDDLAMAQVLATADASPDAEQWRYCAMDASGREWLLNALQLADAGLPLPNFSGHAGLLRQGETRYFAERLADERTPLWLYGAGHVGRALVQVMAGLPFRITWVDSRPEMFDEATALIPENPTVLRLADDPVAEAAKAPAGAWHLVMTHSHDLDLRICEELLQANRFEFLGLIGSRTKEARFRKWLLQKGCSPAAVERMVCPIGIAGIDAKLPSAIAVSVAAQLLQRREAAASRAASTDVYPSLQGVTAS
jgi:xanthine dehydrogenase accessory factor